MILRIEVAQKLADVPVADWNSLEGTGCPFLRHEFLLALEATGCVGGNSGWYPCHLLLRDDAGRLVGAMPLYRKTSSHGEFVFDWSWADAYRRAGLRYYPKLVSAVPFTPATGPRLLFAAGQQPDAIADALLRGAIELARQIEASSVHVLFPTAGEQELLARFQRMSDAYIAGSIALMKELVLPAFVAFAVLGSLYFGWAT